MISMQMQKRVQHFLFAVFISLSLAFGGVQIASAQTPSETELRNVISSLLQQIAVLRAQMEQLGSLEGGSLSDNSIEVGTTVETISTLRVRSSVGVLPTNLLGVVSEGTRGQVVSGPSNSNTDLNEWFQVRYENGVTGWSAGNWLRAVSKSVEGPIGDGFSPIPQLSIVNNNSQTVSVSFNIGTPCTGYTIDWGDGNAIDRTPQRGINCSQVVTPVSHEHTYRNSGQYTIAINIIDSPQQAVQGVTIRSQEFRYTLEDVRRVRSEEIDPIPRAMDDEYTLYTIILRDGTQFEVRRYGLVPYQRFVEAIRETGYTGNVNDLLKLAREIPSVTEVPELEISTSRRSQSATVEFTMPNGCYSYVIDWGDGSSTDRVSNQTGRFCTQATVPVSQTHRYEVTGTYTIAVRVFSNDNEFNSEQTVRVGEDNSQAPTCTLNASENRIIRGQATTLTWNIENAESAILNIRGDQEVLGDSNQRRIVLPPNDYTFRLTLTGENGQRGECTTFVQVVSTDRNSDARCELNVSRDTINRGDATRLTWEVDNAISARLVMPRGTQEVLNDSNQQRWVLPHSDYTFRMEVLDSRERSYVCEREVRVNDNQASIHNFSTTITAIENTLKRFTSAIQ